MKADSPAIEKKVFDSISAIRIVKHFINQQIENSLISSICILIIFLLNREMFAAIDVIEYSISVIAGSRWDKQEGLIIHSPISQSGLKSVAVEV